MIAPTLARLKTISGIRTGWNPILLHRLSDTREHSYESIRSQAQAASHVVVLRADEAHHRLSQVLLQDPQPRQAPPNLHQIATSSPRYYVLVSMKSNATVETMGNMGNQHGEVHMLGNIAKRHSGDNTMRIPTVPRIRFLKSIKHGKGNYDRRQAGF